MPALVSGRRRVLDGGTGFGGGDRRKTPFANYRQRACDKASSTPVVMLHLRSCYVSKAAILTLPVPSVSVENRSPA